MPREPSSRRVVLVAVLVTAGLVLAGIGLNARPRWEFRANFDQVTSRVGTTLSAIALVMVLVFAAYLMALRRISMGEREKAPLWRRIVVGVGALAAVLWLIHVLQLNSAPRRAPTNSDNTATKHGIGPTHHVGADLLIWLGVLIVVLAVVMALLVRNARHQVEAAPAADESSPLAAAERALRGGSDPRARVIDAYDAMEHALSTQARLDRAPQQAPEEWLEHVARQQPAVASAAAELTTLFERARFSRLPVAESDADAAAALVAGMRASLAHEVPVL
jgi:4-amino-4-deoxy-L-arabinose transferase-like glycosyltransferase